MIINKLKFIEKYLKIVNKESNIVPLKLNYAQQTLYNTIKELDKQNKPKRIIILKSRQLGLSTGTGGILFSNGILNRNIKTGIITHKKDATDNLFKMYKIMYDNLPQELQPEISKNNEKSLVFSKLNSEIKCMTAGSDGVGRSDTYIQLHLSEYAFWPGKKKETYLGLIQAVPLTRNSIVIIESTPNGYDDFKDKWDDAIAGKSDFVPLFFPWFINPKYRMKYDGFNLTMEEQEMKKIYNLDNEQISWRRWCIKNNCSNDLDQFKQEYPSCPEEAFLSTGKCIFPKEKVINRLQTICEPIKTGYFDYQYNGKNILSFKFIESKEKQYVKIYEDTKKNYPYVLGGDTAGIGKDSFAGDVINNHTGNQCATLEIDLDETEYTMQMYCLGKYYNNALICIETNYSTYPVKKLYEMGYTNQYLRTIDEGIDVKVQDKLGFNTNKATRPVIISELKEFFEECIELINDKKTLKEALTFIKRSDGKQAADDGYHDDRIMSLAIANKARTQHTYLIEQTPEKNKTNLPFALQDEISDDNLDDYEENGYGLEW